MSQNIQQKIEKLQKDKFDKIIGEVKKNSGASLTSPAKAAAFSRNIHDTILKILNPADWMADFKVDISLGAARDGDWVVGYDWHMITIGPPLLPILIPLGPFPIPFLGRIEKDSINLSLTGLLNKAKSITNPDELLRRSSGVSKKSGAVYINKKRAATDENNAFSLLKHIGPVPFLPMITIMGGDLRPKCTLKAKHGRKVFVNGKPLLRRIDEGSGSCGKGEIIIVDASGSVHVG